MQLLALATSIIWSRVANTWKFKALKLYNDSGLARYYYSYVTVENNIVMVAKFETSIPEEFSEE